MQLPEMKIFLALVYDALGLLSPSMINGLSERRASSIAEITQINITGINSGMAIRREVFCDYRYDERYFLDYIDHAFLRDLMNRNDHISGLDVSLLHQVFFETEEADIDSVCIRFNMFKGYCRMLPRTYNHNGRLGYCRGIIKQKVYFFLKYGKRIKMLFI